MIEEKLDKRRIRRVRCIDRIARRGITIGGIGVITCVCAIFVQIFSVALPLFTQGSARPVASFFRNVSGREGKDILRGGMGLDEDAHVFYLFNREGMVKFYDATNGAPLESIAAAKRNAQISYIERYGDGHFTLLWNDNVASAVHVAISMQYDAGGKPVIRRTVEKLAETPAPESHALPSFSFMRVAETGATLRLDIDASGEIIVFSQTVRENVFGETETQSATTKITEHLASEVSAALMDSAGINLYVASLDGHIYHWELTGPAQPELRDYFPAFTGGCHITALALLPGDTTLVAGDSNGGVTGWFPVETYEAGKRQLELIHQLHTHAGPVSELVTSARSRTVFSLSQHGDMHVEHMTNGRLLARGVIGIPPVDLAINTKGNGLALRREDGQIDIWAIDDAYPEASLRSWFGSIWYENRNAPEFIWQSSGATEAFEPKMSFIPLIFGTFKGTIYAMAFTTPLALLAAIYTSQFAAPGLRRTVKPVVEVMAAVPTVVIGFLAALWLAPLLERNLAVFFACMLAFPITFCFAAALRFPFRQMPFLQHIEKGREWMLLIPVVLAGGLMAWKLAPWMESAYFEGNLKQWLHETLHMRYDSRNCVVVAFGLGFTVVPIIFSISEDALSTIPASMKAASLALGASRWQTVWRVVLPSASPGILAAIIIGFGRAIGETMIVLMATGNTPILDFSPFTGMRTLSANIAVEIPEAPLGGTLYRVLFLSAGLLLCLTTLLNTGAELVRQHLRKKYANWA